MDRYFVALKLGFSPPAASRQPNGLFRLRGPHLARFEIPAGMITTPAKYSRHDVPETLPTACRPLRRGEHSDVYFDDVGSARSV